jgi:WD40 repeat protein
MWARPGSRWGCFVAVFVLIFVTSPAAWAQKPLDVSKLKRGDKLEYKWAFDWEECEFIRRETFNRVRIRVSRTGREETVSLDYVRLPPGVKQKTDDKGPAAHPDNPFATGEEKASALKQRTWSDKDNKFKIEATLVKVDGNDVVLVRADKKEIKVPLDKLSAADKKYVADYQAGKPLEGSETNVDADDTTAERTLLPLTATDLNAAKVITLDEFPKWEYKPDQAGNIISLRDNVRVPLQKVDVHGRGSKLLLLPQEKKAYVIMNAGWGTEKVSVVQACDLGRGKLDGVAAFAEGELPISITPDGKYVLARTDKFHFGTRGELRLYARDGKKVSQVACWQPYNHHRSWWSKKNDQKFVPKPRRGGGFGDNQQESKEEEAEENDALARPELTPWGDVEWAEFIDNNHILTMSHGGELAMWKSPEVEPLYAIKGRVSQPALSPGRNFVALAVPEGIVILRVKDGQPVGLIPLASDNSSGSVAFRPDGKRLALVQGGQWSRIRVWDLESQELVRDFAIKDVTASWMTNATWTTEDHLLTGSTVIDTVRRIPIWRYTHLNEAWQFYGGRAWFVTDGFAGSTQVLTSAVVPPKKAIDAVAKFNPEELLVIRPGLEVEVDLQGGNPEDLALAREAILKRLAQNEMREVPDSKLKLVGRIQPGQTTTVKYHVQQIPAGQPGLPRIPHNPFYYTNPTQQSQISDHSVTEQILTLSFELDGKSVWKYEQKTTPPMQVIAPAGKTFEEALAEKMQQDAKTFGQIWVPSYVALMPGGEDQKAAGATP